MQIVAMGGQHVEDAGELVTARYAEVRASVPALPAKYESLDAFSRDLARLADASPGVAALRSGRLVGFLIAQVIGDFRDMRAAYSPEWANAAAADDVYIAMYQAVAEAWRADGCACHLVSLLGESEDCADAWLRLGFEMEAVDAVRGLSLVNGAFREADIRRAGPDDAELVVDFERRLAAYLADAVGLSPEEPPDADSIRSKLDEGSCADFIAGPLGRAVGWMRIGPANPSACRVIQDEGVSSVVRAFTNEHARGGGVGGALLSRSVAWARENGYGCVAVDFEPHNPPASRFWLRHFAPVCYTVIRRVEVTRTPVR